LRELFVIPTAPAGAIHLKIAISKEDNVLIAQPAGRPPIPLEPNKRHCSGWFNIKVCTGRK